MSDIPEATPRTDTEITRIHGHLLVPAHLSRTLERELIEVRRELEELKVKHDQETCPTCHYMRSPWTPCKCGQCVRRGTNDILRSQLTAHKEALNLCQMALCADMHELFVELRHEAIAAIAKLKEGK